MRHRSGYLIVASSAALAMLYCFVAVEATPATARAPQAEPTNVNRVLKGDRLPVTASRATPVKMQTSVKLPDGCEAIVSAIIRSPLAQVAGRCVS
jgi:hypothetical protein